LYTLVRFTTFVTISHLKRETVQINLQDNIVFFEVAGADEVACQTQCELGLCNSDNIVG